MPYESFFYPKTKLPDLTDPYRPRTKIPKISFSRLSGDKLGRKDLSPYPDFEEMNLEPQINWGPTIRAAKPRELAFDKAIQKLEDMDDLLGPLSLLNPMGGWAEHLNKPSDAMSIGMAADLPGKGIAKKLTATKRRAAQFKKRPVKITDWKDEMAGIEANFPRTIIDPAPLDDIVHNPMGSLTGDLPLASATVPRQAGILDDISNPPAWQNPSLGQLTPSPELTVHGPVKPVMSEVKGPTFGPNRKPDITTTDPGNKYGYTRVEQGDPRLPAHYRRQGTTGPNITVTEALVPERVLKGPSAAKMEIPDAPVKPPELPPDIPTVPPELPPITGKPDVPFLNSSGLPSLDYAPLTKAKPGGIPASLGRSVHMTLRGDSKAGGILADKYVAYRGNKDRLAGGWEQEFDDIVSGLSKDEFETVRHAIDSGDLSGITPNLRGRYDSLRALDDRISSMAEARQLKLRNADGSELVDWKRRENYWPHLYPEEFWEDPVNVAAALSKKYNIPSDMALEMAKKARELGGTFPTEAERYGSSFAKRFGTHLKPFQHQRNLDLPGYRVDPDAYKVHLRDMADRISMKEQFGDLDIADKTGEIAQLLNSTSNPTEVKRMLERVFGRESASIPPARARFANAAMPVEAALHLSNVALSNLQQLAMLPGRTTTRGLWEAIKSLPKRNERLRFGRQSGALNAVHSDNLTGVESGTDLFSKTVNKAYGISAAENFSRSTAAVAGRETALDLFNKLRRNPNNQSVRTRLEHLTMTRADDLLGQSELTEAQIRNAGGRMAELTQGRAQPFDLPYSWTGGSTAPYKKLATMFKNYAFVQPGLLARSFRASPGKTALGSIPAFAGLGYGIGAIKDAKEAAVAGITGNDFGKSWDDSRKSRGDSELGILAKSGLEGWAFGLPADIVRRMNKSKSSGYLSAAEAVAPPLLSDLGRAGTATADILQDPEQLGSYESLGRMMLQSTPYIGYDLASALMPRKRKVSKSSKGLKSLPKLR